MIVSHIIGGLGNQMFQYIAGKALSFKKNTSLKLDISDFADYAPHNYALDVFDLKINITSSSELGQYRMIDHSQKTRLFARVSGKPKMLVYKEPHFQFDPKLFELQEKNIYIKGYWQTEKYFSSIREQVLNDFTVKGDWGEKNQAIEQAMKKTNSISIHIRRGDYVTNPQATAYHGLMGLDYYTAAIKLIEKQVRKPIYYVFSDDPAWCRQNLKIDNPVEYISHNKRGVDDMLLMSKCQHNIIANSSFSWWGAWLNQNPAKIVIAPQRWFNDPDVNTSDVCPSNWMRL